ncbi:MAG: hydroxypyruvate isomerase family protein [Candidatus Eremiobacteraeota bacterium]|nr:hydroxypyruvate isomerase family protein [Candidatus Eremiobacteraeota bacterium]
MIKLAANLTMMFNEVPFLERFEAASACGFKGVEYLFPYEHPVERIASAREAAGVHQALFNLPPGDWSAGERGIAALPGREEEFERSIELALEYALALRTPRVHVMSGLIGDKDPTEMERTYRRNLRVAAERFGERGIEIVIEPINHRDIPRYYLQTTAQACATIDAVGSANLKLQLDLYHCQITEGDLVHHVRDLAGRYSHVQIAGNPDRNEPDRGEVDYAYVLQALDAGGYDGWVGCEYRPRAGTREGLVWAAPFGISG